MKIETLRTALMACGQSEEYVERAAGLIAIIEEKGYFFKRDADDLAELGLPMLKILGRVRTRFLPMSSDRVLPIIEKRLEELFVMPKMVAVIDEETTKILDECIQDACLHRARVSITTDSREKRQAISNFIQSRLIGHSTCWNSSRREEFFYVGLGRIHLTNLN